MPPSATVDSGSSAFPSVSPSRVRPRWAVVVATFFGAGLVPRAPGTVGSVASLLLWAPLILADVSVGWRLATVLLVFAVGTRAAELMVRGLGRQDPQCVVVDEVAGMGVALLLAQPTWWSLAAGFCCFRLFDIWKPGPVRLADRRVKGGVGVMLDDMIAGMLAIPGVWAFETWVQPEVAAWVG